MTRIERIEAVLLAEERKDQLRRIKADAKHTALRDKLIEKHGLDRVEAVEAKIKGE